MLEKEVGQLSQLYGILLQSLLSGLRFSVKISKSVHTEKNSKSNTQIFCTKYVIQH